MTQTRGEESCGPDSRGRRPVRGPGAPGAGSAGELQRLGVLVAGSFEPRAAVDRRLKVVFDGEQYGDDVRVARCHQVPGAGSLYSVGVEFVWTARPDRASLRRFLRTRFLLPRLAEEPH